MLDLEELPKVCMVTFDHDTKYNVVTVHKRVDISLEEDYNFFVEGELQLDSTSFMAEFVPVAYRALAVFDYTSVALHMYVEDLTEDTLGQQAII